MPTVTARVSRSFFGTVAVFAMVTLCAAPAASQPGGQLGAAVAQVQRALEIKNVAELAVDAQAEAAAEAARLSAAARTEQAKLAEVEQRAQQTRNAFRATFLKSLAEVKSQSDRSRNVYRDAFNILAIAGVVLALLSSLSGFVKWSVTAGICGLLTTGVLTVPNLFSVPENFSFYTYVSSQAYALELEAQLLEHPSNDDVERWKNRFLKLAELVANPPSVKDPDQLTRAMIQK
jgi:hypothetical protein